MFGERQLHEDAVNFGVLVIFVDEREKRYFRDIFCYIFLHGIEAELFGGFLFTRYIADRRRIIADNDGHQSRHNAVLLL